MSSQNARLPNASPVLAPIANHDPLPSIVRDENAELREQLNFLDRLHIGQARMIRKLERRVAEQNATIANLSKWMDVANDIMGRQQTDAWDSAHEPPVF
jgi:hypothetical protein